MDLREEWNRIEGEVWSGRGGRLPLINLVPDRHTALHADGEPSIQTRSAAQGWRLTIIRQSTETHMDFADLGDAVAAVAHRCWCKRMLEAGWRPGKLFDPESKEHDCLRPYHDLTPFKRAQIKQRARWEELEPRLASAIDDALMVPEFSAQDIYVGMTVRFADDDSGDIGRVVGWETVDEDSGVLESIRVEWPSGEVVEYAPNGQAIVPTEVPGEEDEPRGG